MIIDIHNIIGHHKYKDFVPAEGLIAEMDKAGVDMAVVFCYAESLDNAYVEEAMKKYPDRLIGLYTVNPWADNAAEDLEDAIVNRGFKGLRLDPVRHGFALNEHQIVYPLIEVCQKHKVPVWCYGAAEVFSTPILFEPIAERFPDVNIILGAMGFTYDASSAAGVAQRCKNVYLDTSGCMTSNVQRALKSAGPKNTVMGTATPEWGYFDLEIKKIKDSTDDQATVELMLGKNAARIFNIEG